MKIDHCARCPDCPAKHQLCSEDPKSCMEFPCLAHLHCNKVVWNGRGITLRELKIAWVQHFCDCIPKGRPAKVPGLSRHISWPLTNATPAVFSRQDMLSASMLLISTALWDHNMGQKIDLLDSLGFLSTFSPKKAPTHSTVLTIRRQISWGMRMDVNLADKWRLYLLAW